MSRAHLGGGLALSALSALILIITGCGDDISAASRGQISATPSQVTFNLVRLGEVRAQPLLIENIGEGDLTINDFAWEGSGDLSLRYPGGGEPEELVLAPNDSYTLEVVYAPSDGVIDEGDVVIDSNDPSRSRLRVRVLSTGATPRIQVTPSREVGVAFGAAEPGDDPIYRDVVIANVGPLPLTVTDLRLTGSTDFAMQLPDGVTFPGEVLLEQGGEALTLTLSYAPDSLGQDVGALLIDSTDPTSPVYELPLVANSDEPCIRVPAEVAFLDPAVPIGEAARRAVSIDNCGNVPLEIVSVFRDDGGSDEITLFEPEGLEGVVIESGASAELEVIYVPLDDGEDSARFFIDSNAPSRAQFDVFARGTSNTCPTADARARVEGSNNFEQGFISAAPLDVLILDGRFSLDDESEVTSWTWEVVERPDTSTRPFEDFEDGTAELFLEVAGIYEFCLTVTDADGIESCAPSCITAEVKPVEKIHVELTWETPGDEIIDDYGSDVDLHFVRLPYGDWLTDWDVYFGNLSPIWAVPGGSVENPSLDIDDKHELGPENINLNDPTPCAWYAVGVHYYTNRGFGPSSGQVRVFINGDELYKKREIPLVNAAEGSSEGDFWWVALIHWDGEIGRVADIYEKYEGGDWIDHPPMIPDSLRQQMEQLVPHCADAP